MSRYRGIGGKVTRGKKENMDKDVIPHAPIGRRMPTAADKDLQRWRVLLNEEFPLLSPEDIARAQQPFHTVLMNEMMIMGESVIAHELNSIFKKEERERLYGRYRRFMSPISLKDQREKLLEIAETLRICQKYNYQGLYEAAINLRKQLAEKFMHGGDIWLAKHFFLSCLSAAKRMDSDDPRAERLQAETHCLLAFLARENNETLESALAIAIDHLAIARSLSYEQPWQFKPRVLNIKLKKPIAIHGLRVGDDDTYEVVDGCSMTIYMIATLLEHEMLISLANQIMHTHRIPTEEDVKIAHEFADHALKLAMEVRQPTAMSSALVRFGLVLRHIGAYEDALTYFEQLHQHAVVIGDHITEAVAYHNIGLCLVGCHNSSKALECFAKQMDISEDFNLKDLEADAMYEVGHLLLQEGHLWEAEECYAISYDNFKALNHSGGSGAWAMLGTSAGHKLWGRFATICRRNRRIDIYNLLDWKCSRRTLNPANRPHYKPQLISDTYPSYVAKMQPEPENADYDDVDYEKLADLTELSAESKRISIAKQKKMRAASVAFTGTEGEEFQYDTENDDTEMDASQLDSDTLPGEFGDRSLKMRRKSQGFGMALLAAVERRKSEVSAVSNPGLPRAQPLTELYNVDDITEEERKKKSRLSNDNN